MKSRAGNLNDFFYSDNLEEYLETISGSEDLFYNFYFEPRNTRDLSFVNTYDKLLCDFCKCNGLTIYNVRTPHGNNEHITSIADKGKTIVDYFIISSCAYHFLSSFKIIPRSESDHISLELVISGNTIFDESLNENITTNTMCYNVNKLKCNSSYSDVYTYQLND